VEEQNENLSKTSSERSTSAPFSIATLTRSTFPLSVPTYKIDCPFYKKMG